MRFRFEIEMELDDQAQADRLHASLKNSDLPIVKLAAPTLIDNKIVSPIMIYCDGGGGNAHHNYAGGWGYRAEHPDGTVIEDWGGAIPTTNNVMELMAVINALVATKPGPPVIVVCDSQYVVQGITKWVHNWIKKGWKTYDGKPVANQELWERLKAVADEHDVQFHWVKGHRGHIGNERADALATIGRDYHTPIKA